MLFRTSLLLGALLMVSVASSSSEQPATEYLSDIQHRFLYHQQGWGALGINTCAYAPGNTPMQLKIKDVEYAKGLGHHAPGEIVVDLSGEYEQFEAEVGVQWQGGNTGSVVFKVLVDDQVKFDSGKMTESSPAKPVRVPVRGAQELRLVVTDAGDGVTCDCADWANARLIRNPNAKSAVAKDLLDIAPFARVTTSDPGRMDGCKSNRIQEFRAEDLFMDSDVKPGADGSYTVPKAADGRAVIGLNWVERRRTSTLGIQFTDGSAVPSAEDVQVQFWAGESIWQGGWKPLDVTLEKNGSSLKATIDWSRNQEAWKGTRKIRWILPPTDKPVKVANLAAFTPTRSDTISLTIQSEKPKAGQRVEVEVYNGTISEKSGNALRKVWDPARPLQINVMYTKPRYWRPDRTVLMLHLPDGACAVGLDDVAAKGCVYIPRSGIFVSTGSTTLQDYKRQIAGKQTILDRVRNMPDQTFEQALAKTRNPVQSQGPVMLSLACDNNKFIVNRDGTVEFTDKYADAEKPQYPGYQYNCLMHPVFGSGKIEDITRHMDGGWLPVPVNTVKDGAIVYSQRSMAAPFNGKTLFVSEFTLENTASKEGQASLTLSFLSDAEKKQQASIQQEEGRMVVFNSDAPVAFIEESEAGNLKAVTSGGNITFSGALPANTSKRYYVYIPAWSVEPDEQASITGGQEFRSDVEDYWNKTLEPAMQIQVPDEQLLNVIKASQVHCLMAARNEDNGNRVAAWIASVSYGPLESEAHSVIRGMDLMGYDEFARKSLDFFVHRYNDQGFLTTGYTLMGIGWHLWTLGEHYELTKDADWLRGVAPDIARVCEWIGKQCDKTKHLDGSGRAVPEYGLMPPGVMADWNAFSFYFCLNSYYYAGLDHAGRALADIGYPGGKSFVERAAKLKEDILKGYRWTQSRSPVYPLQDGTWVEAYPSQLHCAGPTNDFFPGEDGNRSWCYDVELGAHQMAPAGVMDPISVETKEMMNHMEDVQFLSDGWFDYPAEKNHTDWFNLGGFAKVQPYYCRNGEIYAMSDEVKPFIRSYFNSLASLLNTEILWLWEHFNHSGAWNKTHETGYFLQQTRWMLLTERGNELWLAPFVTNNWMKDGMVVSVKDAPSRFGKVSYEIKSSTKQGYIEAAVDPVKGTAPERAVVRLRHPEGKRMKSVLVNGKAYKDFDPAREIIFINPGAEKLAVKALY